VTPLIKELARIVRHPIQRLLLRGVYNRIRQLEYRSFNRRFFCVEQIAEYLIGAQVIGDYCEFGVFEGTTFCHAFRNMALHFPGMKFVAFDSFEGLPQPKGVDAVDGYSSRFYEHEFSCSREDFLRNLRRNGVDLTRVRTIEGWFSDTLQPPVADRHGIDSISVAWIDCDLYESTVPVLQYLTRRLQLGSVLVFDDWRCFRNLPDYGQQRAVREWLEKNPQLTLAELLSFGWNGKVFTVAAT